MNKKISVIFLIIIILFLRLNTNLYAKQNHDELKQQLEEIQKERWQYKADIVKLQKQIRSEIEDIEDQQTIIMQRAYSYEEECFRLKDENDKLNDNLELKKENVKSMINILKQKIDTSRENLSNAFPWNLTERLEMLRYSEERINTSLHKEIPANALKAYWDYSKKELINGRTCEYFSGKVLSKGIDEINALKLRLGYFYYSYFKDDAAGILRPTGELKGKTYVWLEDFNQGQNRKIKKTFSEIRNKKNTIANIYLNPTWSKGAKILKKIKTNVGFFDELINKIRSGGPTMYPLLLILFAGLFIIIERIIFFKKDSKTTEKSMFNIIRYIKEKNFEKLKNETSYLKSDFLKTMLWSISENKKCNRYTAEKSMEEMLIEETSRLEKGLSILAVLAAIAPLLGLLGTVAGMINLFETITIAGTGDPRLMSGGISEALITTLSGLTIAIPLLLAHTFLKNRSASILDNVEKNALIFLNLIWTNDEGKKK